METMKLKRKSIMSIQELTREELEGMVEYMAALKSPSSKENLAGKTLLTLLLTPDIHTRLEMGIAASQLNMQNITMDCTREKWEIRWESGEMIFGNNAEHVRDVARILERHGDYVAVRHVPYSGNWQVDRQDSVIKSLEQNIRIPVYNLGSCLFCPTQGMADLFTIKTKLKTLVGWKAVVAWTQHAGMEPMGPPNSFALAASKFGMDLTIACPEAYDLDPAILKFLQKNVKNHGGSFEVSRDLSKAIKGAHLVYAANWQSIKYYDKPDEEKEARKNLSDWMVRGELMEKTDGGYFMHPVPIKRNVSVTDQILDGNTCLAYDQAENRVHALKAFLLSTMQG